MGPVFGTARAVRASVQATGKLLTNAEGQVVSTVSRVVIRPEDGPVAVGSKVTFVGEHFRVVEAYPVPDARRPTQWELLLSRWATT